MTRLPITGRLQWRRPKKNYTPLDVFSQLIILQLKSTQDESALASISSIIKTLSEEYNFKIRGHEIHQTRSVMATTSLKERVNMVSTFCAKNELNHLAYHAPIFGRGQNIWEETWNDKVRESLALTIDEAAQVRQKAGISGKVIVVFHLTNYLHMKKLPSTIEEKLRLFEVAESEFLKLICDQSADGCIPAIENVYPRLDGDFANIGPYRPQELVRMERHGIRAALDISHYQMYANYLKYGAGNPIGDMDRKAYVQTPDWRQCLKILADSLVLLHISDARGFTVEGEGLLLGKGEVPLLHILREAGSGRTVQGTIELADGHLNKGRLQFEGAKWLLQNSRDLFL